MSRSRFLVNLRPPNAGNLETMGMFVGHIRGTVSSYLQHRCVPRVVICDAKLSDLLRPTRLLTRHANEGKFSKSCAMSNLSSKEWSNHTSRKSHHLGLPIGVPYSANCRIAAAVNCLVNSAISNFVSLEMGISAVLRLPSHCPFSTSTW